MLARDRFTCQRCGSRRELEVDHVVPAAKGGSWELSNLWTLCRTCHRRKTHYEDRGL
ncbi:HNH endonuclease [Streptomyces sp. NPDC000594]|uniref:HNH endonuclease n=1 Tax=Streptomyces sp. NPDC000594 TaxID=3154261 RepID=UPI00332C9005